jgi:hypothetical protein
MPTMTFLPSQFLMYIPGRKTSLEDPFPGLILMNATEGAAGYTLSPDSSANQVTIQLELPAVDPPLRPYKVFVEFYLQDGSLTTRLVTDLTPYILARRNGTGDPIKVYMIPNFKQIFPGSMLRRNIALSTVGILPEQLSAFSIPFTVGPISQQQAAAALVLSSLHSSSLSLPLPFSATPSSLPPPSSLLLSPLSPLPLPPLPLSPLPQRVKKLVAGSGLPSYIASQLKEFAQMKGEVCPITAGPFEDNDSVVMPCGHVFSRLAITESFKTQHGKCPACRLSGSPVYI